MLRGPHSALPSAHPNGETDPPPGRQQTRQPWHAHAAGRDAATRECARDTRNYMDEFQRRNAEGGQSQAWPALRFRLRDTLRKPFGGTSLCPRNAFAIHPGGRGCQQLLRSVLGAMAASVLTVTAGPLSRVLRFTEPHGRKSYLHCGMTLNNK